jgi:hypothetical protein
MSEIKFNQMISVLQPIKSRDSSVGIAMGYGVEDRGSIPGRGEILLFYTVPRQALGPIQPPTQWVSGTLSPGIKRQWREADH